MTHASHRPPRPAPPPLISASAAGHRRFLALHLPRLPTDRVRRAEPALHGAPLATWARQGNRRLLAAVDARAAAAGLRPGRAVADGQAILPGLVLRPADPAADATALAWLALWALRWTPLAAAEPPDGLLLDITGCAHRHGGEPGLLRDATARLRGMGLDACAAVAGAPATAMALARGGRDGAVVPAGAPGAEAAAVAPLPLAVLRLPAETTVALHRLGLRRVGDLLALPRGPLARRFGAALPDRLDEATGVRRRPIRPVRPPPDLAAARDFAESVATRAGIDAALDRLLDDLCRRLREAGRGARRVALLAFRLDGTVQEVAVGTGLPVREPAHLRRLFAEVIGRLEPGESGFERLALEARATDPLPGGVQRGLPGSAAAAMDGGEAEEVLLARLLDRLGQRLRLHRPVPRASHWPERAVAAVAPFEAGAAVASGQGWAAFPSLHPVRLLRRPVPLLAGGSSPPRSPGAPAPLLRWDRGGPGSVRGGGGNSAAPRGGGLGWPSDLTAGVELRRSHP